MSESIALVFAPRGSDLPVGVREWLRARQIRPISVASAEELMLMALRSRPRLALFDARGNAAALDACAALKKDSYTAIVPSIVLAGAAEAEILAALGAGADEILLSQGSNLEVEHRMDAVLRRSDRDTQVHPSTRLPGTIAIEAEIDARLSGEDRFAVCYADLDHFKEFNDRYGYYEGDRVIRVVAKILHDVVKGMCGSNGFVGHIGGDDFIFIVPLTKMEESCAEIVSIFDAVSPYQYSEQDRRAGYFFGKDRRGQLHRVPLMTLSIGVVTNERRQFTHASQVSALATEMKSYAKTLEGSVFSLDRRQGPVDETQMATPGRSASVRQGDDR